MDSLSFPRRNERVIGKVADWAQAHDQAVILRCTPFQKAASAAINVF